MTLSLPCIAPRLFRVRRRRHAFTLIEVMVAAALFMLFAGIIYTANIFALRTAKDSTCDMVALGAAQNICNQVAACGYPALIDRIPSGATPFLTVNLLNPLDKTSRSKLGYVPESDDINAVFDEWPLQYINNLTTFDLIPVPLDFTKRSDNKLTNYIPLVSPVGAVAPSKTSQRGLTATTQTAPLVRVTLTRVGQPLANCVKVEVVLRYRNARGEAAAVHAARVVSDVAAKAGYNS